MLLRDYDGWTSDAAPKRLSVFPSVGRAAWPTCHGLAMTGCLVEDRPVGLQP